MRREEGRGEGGEGRVKEMREGEQEGGREGGREEVTCKSLYSITRLLECHPPPSYCRWNQNQTQGTTLASLAK